MKLSRSILILFIDCHSSQLPLKLLYLFVNIFNVLTIAFILAFLILFLVSLLIFRTQLIINFTLFLTFSLS